MMAAARRHAGILLSRLLPGVPAGMDREIRGITADSRQVAPGTVFFARRGLTVDGASFIDDALRAGAAGVVREGEPGARLLAGEVPEITVADVANALGLAAHRFFGEPSAELRLTGVTGPNGKTSVSHFIAQALSARATNGNPAAGIIGTLGYGPAGKLEPGVLTTPDVTDLHRLLAEMRSAGLREIVMEVSSHALSQGRVAGIRFDTAVFTNLSRDHLDFHGSMADYGAAKEQLFHTPGLEHAVINVKDEFGRRLLGNLAGIPDVVAYTTGGAEVEDFGRKIRIIRGKLLVADADGLELEASTGSESGTLRVPLLGRFTADNLLAAMGALMASGIPFVEAIELLRGISPVPGRMQPFDHRQEEPLVVVDYSHTPEALDSALRSLREHCVGRLWCVFGCGGDRDPGKRSQMGAVADALADVVVLTDDNPRGEDGDAIVDAIVEGIERLKLEKGNLIIERDRAAAIANAIRRAEAGDVILVAGKGHETYQETRGVRRPFSDAAAVRNALEARRT
ncbi:MAG: UDP-N-acetylmuramoyl-L-alanyl-D-glutamate--2,6-diaminopimelate ligase [Gammaproteobacteria bacterium]|nr:UDP-N-acetylmuramoyl-L-alanyl-D-glutamate--2,6-diaminopimelate ligase [Gammaproteobacteria bacterium]